MNSQSGKEGNTSKKGIMKSVNVTGQLSSEGYKIIAVEELELSK